MSVSTTDPARTATPAGDSASAGGGSVLAAGGSASPAGDSASSGGSVFASARADAAWTLDALRAVWEHQHDRVYDRIGSIERALAALADDHLDDDLRRDAHRAAHMLAGSLGMFGFVGASEAAHRLERHLPHATPRDAQALSALMVTLGTDVRGPVRLLDHICEQDSSAHH